jgi:hypothetical protein
VAVFEEYVSGLLENGNERNETENVFSGYIFAA